MELGKCISEVNRFGNDVGVQLTQKIRKTRRKSKSRNCMENILYGFIVALVVCALFMSSA